MKQNGVNTLFMKKRGIPEDQYEVVEVGVVDMITVPSKRGKNDGELEDLKRSHDSMGLPMNPT